ncbi:hypothetical protein [Parazoarcus communis]|uniref:hypothetical protein n=1 Tax=Parazoarcus communis TaxID=41977 RepID=UPI00131F2F89|nr:hypothetical protein [Parazoarcus communis]
MRLALILVCRIHFAFQFRRIDAIDLGAAYQIINSLYSCMWNVAFHLKCRENETRTCGKLIAPRSLRENKTQT